MKSTYRTLSSFLWPSQISPTSLRGSSSYPPQPLPSLVITLTYMVIFSIVLYHKYCFLQEAFYYLSKHKYSFHHSDSHMSSILVLEHLKHSALYFGSTSCIPYFQYSWKTRIMPGLPQYSPQQSV